MKPPERPGGGDGGTKRKTESEPKTGDMFEVLKSVPILTPALLDIDLTRDNRTWLHVDHDPARPDMNYFIQ